MANFDEAKTATENMFNEIPEQTPAEASSENKDKMLSEATDIAEQATEIAQRQSTEISQVMSENERLKVQNEQLQKTISEMSQTNKEKIIEEAMTMPTIDFNELAFADEETQRSAQENYANAMTEYVRKGIMDEMSPYIEQAKAGQREKEKSDAIASLSQVPELKDIETMMPQIEHIIANNKGLQSDEIPIDEKLILAYTIARGVNAINTPAEKKDLTDDELMALYEKNTAFQELIEKKRIEALKNSQQVPPFSASNGAVNVALNIKEKPKTWDDASERTRNLFGR